MVFRKTGTTFFGAVSVYVPFELKDSRRSPGEIQKSFAVLPLLFYGLYSHFGENFLLKNEKVLNFLAIFLILNKIFLKIND